MNALAEASGKRRLSEGGTGISATAIGKGFFLKGIATTEEEKKIKKKPYHEPRRFSSEKSLRFAVSIELCRGESPSPRAQPVLGKPLVWQGWGGTWHGTALFGLIPGWVLCLVQTWCTAGSFLPVLINTSDFVPPHSRGEAGEAHAQQILAPAPSL